MRKSGPLFEATLRTPRRREESVMARKRVLVVGLGNMGMSHALAYARIPGFEVVGACERRIDKRKLPKPLEKAAKFSNYERALAELKPDVVSVNTLPDTHADFAIKAMEAGAHVFVEKPLADTAANAEKVVATAKRTGRKLVIGYILRHHPSWIKFIEIARELGTPLVFRMNLNQQSNGETWAWHKRLMESFPPIVDCGVHYVDVMCQMTSAKPIKVHAIGARLTEEVPINNYGQLQVIFDDGSVGWYEAGWGPMISETAFFVKDVFGPKGSVSIVMAENSRDVRSDDINAHTKTNQILRHHTDMSKPDERIDMSDEPDHDALCEREQRYLLRAIDEDIDLSDPMNDGVKSLKIVLAADKSIHTGEVVAL
jgi:predicted dehydrogenase